jgi:thymidylate synthase (FAD)
LKDGNAITLTSEISVRLVQKSGGDHMVVAAARVSTSGEDAMAFADPEKAEENAGLIRYLMKHRHGTPFEHASLTFFVHAPIFVWREWHRHRIMSFNEESGRYKKLDPVFWVPRRDRKMCPVEGWKPGRPKFLTLEEKNPNALEHHLDFEHRNNVNVMREAYHVTYNAYLNLLQHDIALEVARAVLPVGIYSSCWVTCNPRSLMHFLSLRTHGEDATFVSYPQAEIEEAARACEAILAEGWPITYKAFCDHGRVAP